MKLPNRITEIQFLDRNSHYDEMVAHLATGYNELENTLNDSMGIIHKLKALKNHISIQVKVYEFQSELDRLLMIQKEKVII